MAFVGASDFSIQGDICNVIEGDQIINQTTQIIHYREKQRTIYDEFYDVKLGAMYRLRDIHCGRYPRRWDIGMRWDYEEGSLRADRMICAAKIHREEGATFTVVSYSGPDARKAWKKDFQQFSRNQYAKNIQLFGINRSNVPMLIFYNELVPVSHVWEKIGGLGRSYLYTLGVNSGRGHGELWIDSQQGSLIWGLQGPICNTGFYFLGDLSMSSSTDLLDCDVLWCYLSCLPLDKEFDEHVLDVLESPCRQVHWTNMKTNKPIILSSASRHSPVAIGNIVWSTFGSCLSSRVLSPDGVTRFTLYDSVNPVTVTILEDQWWGVRVWLSQALYVFHKLGISLDDNLSDIKLIQTNITLEGSPRCLPKEKQQLQDSLPIYLFMHPLPTSSPIPMDEELLSCLPEWSHDENGQTSIPRSSCKWLGLPTTFSVISNSGHELSWSNEAYRNIHRWQLDRGFDPTTTDFACYLGYPLWEVIQLKSSQFEELDRDLTIQMYGKPEENKQQAPGKSSFWSMLAAPFSYTAGEGSEIPAIPLLG